MHHAHSGPPRFCSFLTTATVADHGISFAKISNTQLRARISAFGSGLVKHAGLVPHESNVLLLLNDSLGPSRCVSLRVL